MNDVQRGILGATIVGIAGIIGGPALALIGFVAAIAGIKTLDGSSRSRHAEDEQDKEPTGDEWSPLESLPRLLSRHDYSPYINRDTTYTPRYTRPTDELPEFVWHRPESPRADLGEQYRLRTPNYEELVSSLNDEDENLNEAQTPQRSAEPSMRNEAYFERQRQRRR